MKKSFRGFGNERDGFRDTLQYLATLPAPRDSTLSDLVFRLRPAGLVANGNWKSKRTACADRDSTP